MKNHFICVRYVKLVRAKYLEETDTHVWRHKTICVHISGKNSVLKGWFLEMIGNGKNGLGNINVAFFQRFVHLLEH